MTRTLPYYALVAAVVLWCAAIVGLPLAASAGVTFSDTGYGVFSLICHQMESRSIHIAGYPMAVCERCSAIYFGFLLGVILAPALSGRQGDRARIFWAAALAPMLVDVSADLLAIHSSTMTTRLASGGIFGIVAALILTPLIVATFSSHSTA